MKFIIFIAAALYMIQVVLGFNCASTNCIMDGGKDQKCCTKSTPKGKVGACVRHDTKCPTGFTKTARTFRRRHRRH